MTKLKNYKISHPCHQAKQFYKLVCSNHPNVVVTYQTLVLHFHVENLNIHIHVFCIMINDAPTRIWYKLKINASLKKIDTWIAQI